MRVDLGENVTLYLGDCLDVLSTLDPGSIQAVVTDPPYGMANDCDYSRFTKGPRSYGGANTRKYAPVIGDNKPFDPAPWLAFDKVILWGFHHFAAALPVGSVLVWVKRYDAAFGTFLSDAELAWMKGGHGVYCYRDLSMYGQSTSKSHPTEKPVTLMRWCIEQITFPAARILDPFMGSGTTGVAAVQTGRKFIGVEISEEYFQIARRRIEDALAQPHLIPPAMYTPTQAPLLELA